MTSMFDVDPHAQRIKLAAPGLEQPHPLDAGGRVGILKTVAPVCDCMSNSTAARSSSPRIGGRPMRSPGWASFFQLADQAAAAGRFIHAVSLMHGVAVAAVGQHVEGQERGPCRKALLGQVLRDKLRIKIAEALETDDDHRLGPPQVAAKLGLRCKIGRPLC